MEAVKVLQVAVAVRFRVAVEYTVAPVNVGILVHDEPIMQHHAADNGVIAVWGAADGLWKHRAGVSCTCIIIYHHLPRVVLEGLMYVLVFLSR